MVTLVEVLLLGWMDQLGVSPSFDFLEVFAGRQALTEVMSTPEAPNPNLESCTHALISHTR